MGRNKVVQFLIIFFLLTIAALSLIFAFQQKQVSAPTTDSPPDQTNVVSKVKVGNQTVSVEVMSTQAQLQQGLSDRESLAADSGMYFNLGQRGQASFWMKDMKFPIDIIWIDKGIIVGIEHNAPIPTSATVPTFTSPQEVTHVLEVNAGFSVANNLQIGDKVTPL